MKKKSLILAIIAMMMVGCSKPCLSIPKVNKCPKLGIVKADFGELENIKIKVAVKGDDARVKLKDLKRVQRVLKKCKRDREDLIRVCRFYKKEIREYNKKFAEEKKK